MFNLNGLISQLVVFELLAWQYYLVSEKKCSLDKVIHLVAFSILFLFVIMYEGMGKEIVPTSSGYIELRSILILIYMFIRILLLPFMNLRSLKPPKSVYSYVLFISGMFLLIEVQAHLSIFEKNIFYSRYSIITSFLFLFLFSVLPLKAGIRHVYFTILTFIFVIFYSSNIDEHFLKIMTVVFSINFILNEIILNKKRIKNQEYLLAITLIVVPYFTYYNSMFQTISEFISRDIILGVLILSLFTMYIFSKIMLIQEFNSKRHVLDV